MFLGGINSSLSLLSLLVLRAIGDGLFAKQKERDDLEAMKRRLRNKGRHSNRSWRNQLLKGERLQRCSNDVITPTVALPERRPASAIRLTERKQQQQQQRAEDVYRYTTEDVDQWLDESDDDEEADASEAGSPIPVWDSRTEDERRSAYNLSGQPSRRPSAWTVGLNLWKMKRPNSSNKPPGSMRREVCFHTIPKPHSQPGW